MYYDQLLGASDTMISYHDKEVGEAGLLKDISLYCNPQERKWGKISRVRASIIKRKKLRKRKERRVEMKHIKFNKGKNTTHFKKKYRDIRKQALI